MCKVAECTLRHVQLEGLEGREMSLLSRDTGERKLSYPQRRASFVLVWYLNIRGHFYYILFWFLLKIGRRRDASRAKKGQGSPRR